jgi:large subunit ribosomal protein L3
MSLGILGRKLGMMQWFGEGGRALAATVIGAEPNVIVQIKRAETDGYNALQVGYGEIREKLVTKPLKGHFAKAGIPPKRQLCEFRLDDVSAYKIGQPLGAELFSAGETVKVSAISKGHGFAGVMKRHDFRGGDASHGASLWHRRPGSIGGIRASGHVRKGKPMAGHMGHVRVTTRGLKVLAADPTRQVIVVSGAVPGPRNALVELRRDG